MIKFEFKRKKRPLSHQQFWSNFQVCHCAIGIWSRKIFLWHSPTYHRFLVPHLLPSHIAFLSLNQTRMLLNLPVTRKETIFLPLTEVFSSIIIDNIQVSLVFLLLDIILGQIWHFRFSVKAFFVSAILLFTQISVDFVWVSAPGFWV